MRKPAPSTRRLSRSRDAEKEWQPLAARSNPFAKTRTDPSVRFGAGTLIEVNTNVKSIADFVAI
jgi:hypothetical protein